MSQWSLPAATHIGHIHLQVTQLKTSLNFYEDVLGFKKLQAKGATAALSANGVPPQQIILTERAGGSISPNNSTGLYHAAIRLPHRHGLARVLRRLLDLGYPLAGLMDNLVSEVIYVQDPDGNGIEFYADRPLRLWRWHHHQIQMDRHPLDMNEVLSELGADPGPWRGIDAGADIGHVHLKVTELCAPESFYHGVLGLDVTQRDYPGAIFFSAGGYHHHIGVNTWESSGGEPAPDDAPGLLSYSLVIPDAAAWKMLLERLAKAGIKIERWIADNKTIAAFIRDADSIGLELATDRARLDEEWLKKNIPNFGETAA
jgi:catechol 2,3-dioxygenase